MHVSADLETTMGKRVTELNEKDMQFQISLLEERQQTECKGDKEV